VSAYAILGIVALSMLPVEHAHSTSRGSIVHRHASDADHHAGSVEVSSHGSVTAFCPTYISTPSFGLVRPPLTSYDLLPPPPARVVRRIHRAVNPLPHGPPVRLDSLPAPPA
jgi:hypothetical protein